MKMHFIGIGGIGVSGLAGYYLSKGHQISGSDLDKSAITESLEKQGAKIFYGPHKAANLSSDVNLVVHTSAATTDNLELKKARKLKIKTQTYPQALGDLTRKMFTIVVSGMHGKSTTTAMISLVLEKAGLDPTVIVGTKVREWDNLNYRVGKSKLLVIEADEYKAAFLNYWPKIIVLTNIEEEHLDYYKDLKHIMSVFKKYVRRLSKDGVLVANSQDKNVVKITQNAKRKTQNYSTKLKNKKLRLLVPGQHNISNAMAVLKVAKILKMPEKTAIKALNEFSGTWRRMEYRGEVNGAKIYDDYGHHPTEIKATLEGARGLLRPSLFQREVRRDFNNEKIHPRLPRFARRCGQASPPLQKEGGRLWCIFQPHQYQRTYKLFNQFVSAFDSADRTIILPIYSVAGREKESIKKKVSSETLVGVIQNAKRKTQNHNSKLKTNEKESLIYIESFKKAKNYLKRNLKKGDVCVIMGAGDVYKLTEILLKQ